jgi:hypothetical protein
VACSDTVGLGATRQLADCQRDLEESSEARVLLNITLALHWPWAELIVSAGSARSTPAQQSGVA